MTPDAKAKVETKTADTQGNDTKEKTLSPEELGQVAGGRNSSDPCEGGQIR
jgi:hypothetical protein